MAQHDGFMVRRDGPGVTAMLTVAMALPMSVLYAVGALGPQLAATFDVSNAALGQLITASFAVAAVLSVGAGAAVDRFGVRASLLVLFLTVGAAFVVLASATGFLVLAAAMAIAGVAQALANPATNRVIADLVPPARRSRVVGVKQAGVQIGALVVGLAVPALVGVVGWRGIVLAGVPLAVAAGIAVLRLRPPARPEAPPPARAGSRRPNRHLGWLMGFQFLLGCGLATVTTYVTVYAHTELGVGAGPAAGLLAVFGVAGVASRILVTRLAGQRTLVAPTLGGLVLAAAGGAAVLAAGGVLGATAAWAGVLVVGATAVGANALAMVAVVRDRRTGPVGHASALLSMGFFGGFAVSPPLLGAVADRAGFGPTWLVVTGFFVAAAGCAVAVRRHEARPVDAAAGRVAVTGP